MALVYLRPGKVVPQIVDASVIDAAFHVEASRWEKAGRCVCLKIKLDGHDSSISPTSFLNQGRRPAANEGRLQCSRDCSGTESAGKKSRRQRRRSGDEIANSICPNLYSRFRLKLLLQGWGCLA